MFCNFVKHNLEAILAEDLSLNQLKEVKAHRLVCPICEKRLKNNQVLFNYELQDWSAEEWQKIEARIWEGLRTIPQTNRFWARLKTWTLDWMILISENLSLGRVSWGMAMVMAGIGLWLVPQLWRVDPIVTISQAPGSLSQPAVAVPPQRVVAVSGYVFEGPLQEPVQILNPLQSGLRYQTEPYSGFSVKLREGTGFTVTEKSVFEVLSLNEQSLHVFLKQGALQGKVLKTVPPFQFMISTPNAEIKIVGTVFEVSVKRNRQKESISEISVLEGRVLAYNRSVGKTLSIEADQKGILRQDKSLLMDTPSITVQQLREFKKGYFTDDTVDEVNVGILVVQTDPPAGRVFINEQYGGQAPFFVQKKAGHYRIRIESEGRGVWQQEVTITTGARTEIRSDLTGKVVIETGMVKIVSSPSLAQVLIDGKNAGHTPTTKLLALGKHQVRIEKEGYTTFERMIEIKSRDEVLPIMGRLRVRASEQKIIAGTEERAEISKREMNVAAQIYADSISDELAQGLFLKDIPRVVQQLLAFRKTYFNAIFEKDVQFHVADALRRLNYDREAVHELLLFADQFSNDPMAEFALWTAASICRVDLKDYAQAIEIYLRLSQQYPFGEWREDVAFQLAGCYYVNGESRKTNVALESYESRYPAGKYQYEVEKMRIRMGGQ